MKGLRSEQWNIMWPWKEWNSAICTNVDGPIMYYANWNKSDKYCISLICGWYKQYRLYKQNKQIHRKRKQTSCYKRQNERNRDKLGVQGKQIQTQLSSVQLLSHVQLFATPWTAACLASLSITNSRCLFKFISIQSVMPSNHLILCCPLLLPSIFPSIMVFSNESALQIRWTKYWSFSFSINPSNEYSGLISFRID